MFHVKNKDLKFEFQLCFILRSKDTSEKKSPEGKAHFFGSGNFVAGNLWQKSSNVHLAKEIPWQKIKLSMSRFLPRNFCVTCSNLTGSLQFFPFLREKTKLENCRLPEFLVKPESCRQQNESRRNILLNSKFSVTCGAILDLL